MMKDPHEHSDMPHESEDVKRGIVESIKNSTENILLKTYVNGLLNVWRIVMVLLTIIVLMKSNLFGTNTR